MIFTFNISRASSAEEQIQNTEQQISQLWVRLIRGKEIFDSDIYEVSDEIKQENNIMIAMLGGGLVLYWILILVIFEKEDKTKYKIYEKVDDNELFEKYNPMLAGALAQNRQVLPRDVTAVILNLINKKAINMRMVPTLKGKELYTYMISKNRENVYELDDIERFVVNWIFDFYEDDEIDLIKKLKKLSTKKDFSKKMKILDRMTKHKLNEYGKEIISTSILVIVGMFSIISVVFLVTPYKYICLDIFVMFMSLLIVKTDHLMLKNAENIMQDYNGLKEIENKIKEYSLIKDH